MAQRGLKMGSFHLIVHPKWSTIIFEKKCFKPICHPFLVQQPTIFKVFWDFPPAKMRHHGLKTG